MVREIKKFDDVAERVKEILYNTKQCVAGHIEIDLEVGSPISIKYEFQEIGEKKE